LKEILASYVNAHQNDWDEWLPLVQFAMNNSWQESIRTTPFMLNSGEHPVMPNAVHLPHSAPASQDLVRHIVESVRRARAAMAEAQKRQRQQANRRRRPVSFSEGDLVMLTAESLNFKAPGSRKLMPKWVGPFPVTSVVSPVNVRLLLPTHGGWSRVHPVFHVSRVRPYHRRPGYNPEWRPPPLIYNPDGSVEWEVQAILDHKERAVSTAPGRPQPSKKITHYLVRWQGWTAEHDTWEPAAHLINSPDLVAAYRREHHLDTPSYA
jgi:hypothetical protein